MGKSFFLEPSSHVTLGFFSDFWQSIPGLFILACALDWSFPLAMTTRFLVALMLVSFAVEDACSLIFSSRLIHRFSDEAKALSTMRKGEISLSWPRRLSLEYYRMLLHRDVGRTKMKIDAKYPSLVPLQGSEVFSFGDDLGWLHYTWVDVGTPNVSFLVALDTGSDLFWVPCDCIHCAPLSGSLYKLDRDLSMYSPSESRTSKPLSCNHDLCLLGSKCKSSDRHCPYVVNYYSVNTSSSGLLLLDTVYLRSGNAHTSTDTVQTQVIIGCGRIQSGGLDEIAPDGVLGLGFGNISIPSFLARAGLVRDSFSLCFNEDGNGRIVIGDQGISTHKSTPFLDWEGRYVNYFVGVDGVCIGSECLSDTNFRVLVDCGSSFTFLPADVYDKVTAELDRQINASRVKLDDSPWEYCYRLSSTSLPKFPGVTIKFSGNESYAVHNPGISYTGKEGGLDCFCLALQKLESDIGTIGQNLMTGYNIVFDRENLQMRWSASNCSVANGNSSSIPTSHKGLENQLPTNEEQNSHGPIAVSPAVAGRTPDHASGPETAHSRMHFCFLSFLLLFFLLAVF